MTFRFIEFQIILFKQKRKRRVLLVIKSEKIKNKESEHKESKI